MRFRSPLLTQSIVFFLFLRLLRCFTSPGIAFFSLSSSPSPVCLPLRAVFRCRFGFRKSHAGITLHRLPHSEISGSSLMCSSPKLIAACHVLLRLLEPRHSLCALISLILLLIFYPVSQDLRLRHLQSSFAVFPKIKSDCFLRSSRDQEIVSFFYYPVCSCQRTWWNARLRRRSLVYWQWFARCFVMHLMGTFGDGGPCWTRTSDPRLIKAVL